MKSAFKKLTWMVIVVMIALLGLTVAAVASDIVWPWSSEPGFEPIAISALETESNRLDEGGTGVGEPAVQEGLSESSEAGEGIAAQAQAAVAELQPDDSGYTGPIIEASQEDLAPSGDAPVEEVDWDALIPEDAPDMVNTNADPNWSPIYYYYHVAGSALRPRDSSVEWGTGGSGGCLQLASGATYVIFNVHLEVPEGARIEYLRLFYYDTSASNSQAWVTLYDDDGGYDDVTNVASEGNTGYGTALSEYFEHIINTTNYSYVLNWRPNVVGSTMQLCGLRVAYRLP